jgi:hypothetical protein
MLPDHQPHVHCAILPAVASGHRTPIWLPVPRLSAAQSSDSVVFHGNTSLVSSVGNHGLCGPHELLNPAPAGQRWLTAVHYMHLRIESRLTYAMGLAPMLLFVCLALALVRAIVFGP